MSRSVLPARHLAVLATLFTLLAGFALPAVAQPRSGGTLTIVQGAEPAALVSGVNTSTFIGTVSTKIHEGLLEYDFDLKPRPGLAESWSVAPDGKTYTFKLRRGVTWHDGKPFTSADVKFSLEEIWKKLHPRGRVTFGKVTAVDTPDATTVVVRLSEPTPMMLAALSSYESQVLPKHVYEGKDFTTHPALNAPIGTGRSSSRSGRRATSSAWRRTPTTGTRASRTSTPSWCGWSPTRPRGPPPSRRARCSSACSTRCRSPTSSA